MIAVRARLVGEGGRTCAWFSRFSGPVARKDCTAAVLSLRLRRGEDTFGTVAKRGRAVVVLDLRLFVGEANPGGATNPAGFGTAVGEVGSSSVQTALSVLDTIGPGGKNNGGCSDIPAGVPWMVSNGVLLKLPRLLLGLRKAPMVRRCFR